MFEVGDYVTLLDDGSLGIVKELYPINDGEYTVGMDFVCGPILATAYYNNIRRTRYYIVGQIELRPATPIEIIQWRNKDV